MIELIRILFLSAAVGFPVEHFYSIAALPCGINKADFGYSKVRFKYNPYFLYFYIPQNK